MNIRIAKRIAETREYSRRKAEELIFNGQVTVNKVLINTPNLLVSPDDIIAINGRVLHFQTEAPTLFLFHKPKGMLTSKSDPVGRQTIFDILPNFMQNLLYVGRLDYNSEGLLLLTNNGHLVNELTLAKNNIERVYKVKTFGSINNNTLAKLKHGVTINGVNYYNINASIISQSGPQSWISFKLTEGKNNEIRKICEFLGLSVSKLVRVSYGLFSLGSIPYGSFIEVNKNILISTLQSMRIQLK